MASEEVVKIKLQVNGEDGKKQVKEFEFALDQMQDTFRQLGLEVKKTAQEEDQMVEVMQKIDGVFVKVKMSAKELEAALKKSGFEFEKIETEAEKAAKALKAQEEAAKAAAKANEEAANKAKASAQNLQDLGSKISGIGMQITGAFTVPIVGAFAAAAGASKALQDAIAPIKNEFAQIFVELGNALAPIVAEYAPALIAFARGIVDMVKWFGDLDPVVKNLVVGFALLVAAIGPIMVIVGQAVMFFGNLQLIAIALGTSIPALGASFTAFGTAAGAAVAPLIPLIATLMVLIGLINYIANNTTFKQLLAMGRGGFVAAFQGAEAGKTELYNASKEYGLLNQPAPAGKTGGGTNITYINNGVDTNNPILNQIMGPIVNNQLRTNGMR